MKKKNVKKETFQFLSQDNRTKIHGVRWLPEDEDVRAILQISHGMVEYIERYEEFASYLASRGFLVVGHDHLGHGESIRSESEWGYFGAKPVKLLMGDLHQVYWLTRQRYPGIPYFILGHSMGSYLLRAYLTRYSADFTGAIICGTGTEPDAVTTFGIFLSLLLGKLKGDHYRSSFINQASFGKPYAKFDMTGKDPDNSWLSRNVESVKSYYADPKCSFSFTVNGYYMLFSIVKDGNHLRSIKKIRKDLPLLFLSGELDPVGHAGAGVRKVVRKFAKAGMRDMKLKFYKDDRHEILQELDREQVFSDIYRWCMTKMK